MSGGVAYVYDPRGRFADLCNTAMVQLEPVQPAEPAPHAAAEEAYRPAQRALSVDNNGMGDMLRFDAERLRILIERHHLHTGSKRAAEILENWDDAVGSFVKVMPTDYRRALLELSNARETAAAVAAE
jgi:glutamate synthase (NADPH/NADH) large chain